MALVDEILKELEDFGTSLKDDTQQSLRDKGVTFGGQDSKLSNKIRFVIKQSNGGITFNLLMPQYGLAVDDDRKAAGVSQDGQKNISSWIKRKGMVGKFANDTLQARLKKQAENKTDRKKKKLVKPSFEKSLKALTYLVSRKLKQKGFKGNHFFTKVVNDGRIKALQDRLSKLIKTEILIQIKPDTN